MYLRPPPLGSTTNVGTVQQGNTTVSAAAGGNGVAGRPTRSVNPHNTAQQPVQTTPVRPVRQQRIAPQRWTQAPGVRAEQPIPRHIRATSGITNVRSPPPPPPPPPPIGNKRKHPVALPRNAQFQNMKRARPSMPTHNMAQQPVSVSRDSTVIHHTTRVGAVPPRHHPQQMLRASVTPVRHPAYRQAMAVSHTVPRRYPYARPGVHPQYRMAPHMNPATYRPAWGMHGYYPQRTYQSPYHSRMQSTANMHVKPTYNTERFVDLTRDVMSEREDMRIKYGTLKALLFGPESKQDHVSVGVEVRLKRRMLSINSAAIDNRLDIDVEKVGTGQVVGNVDVITAEAFAKLIGKDQIEVKGQIIEFDAEFLEENEDFEPPPGRYAARLKLDVYGQYNRAEATALELKPHEHNLEWGVRHPSFQIPSASNRRRQAQSPSVEISKIENDFNNIFGDSMRSENMPPMNPGRKLKAKLLEYQRVGLGWMVSRERKNNNRSLFWVEKNNDVGGYKYWENSATGQRTTEAPEEFRGGILADDMGLGKTIQSISLICTSFVGKGPTLIIAPLSVLDTWVKQIKEHTHRGELKINEYYGPQREKDPATLSEFDIVITTYNIVSQEWSEIYGTKKKKKKTEQEEEKEEDKMDEDELEDLGEDWDDDEDETNINGIHAVEWLRVVLDEAHQIRSRKTKTFKAVSALKSDSRWCLTGTPVQNKLDDLYSLICFLKVEPFTNQSTWKQLIQQPLKHQDTAGFEKLRKLMQYICLRRTKDQELGGKPIVRLPPKKIMHEKLEFNTDELKLYQHLEARSKRKFKKMTSKSLLENYAHVLEMLLRLRQCCGHPLLVPRGYLLNEKGQKKGSEEDYNQLLKDISDCNICWKLAVDPVITHCKHMFCKKCLTKEASKHQDPHNAPCPFCSEYMDLAKVIDANQLDESRSSYNRLQDQNTSGYVEGNEFALIRDSYVRREGEQLKKSAKIRALIEFVLNRPYDIDSKGLNKSVVFSQWTSMLDLVEECLRDEGIQSVRLDGSMARRAREESFLAFQNDPNKLVFLLSLKAGNLGLNLTAANRVFLLDPWWNPSQEDQAIDRVHRLGQVRPVQVIRFVMKNTVEEKIISLQDKKRKLAQGALGNMSKEQLREMMMEDLKSLFA